MPGIATLQRGKVGDAGLGSGVPRRRDADTGRLSCRSLSPSERLLFGDMFGCVMFSDDANSVASLIEHYEHRQSSSGNGRKASVNNEEMRYMKTESVKLCLIAVGLTIVIAVSSYKSYCFGRRAGILDGELKRVPFDLVTYIRMYEMSDYIHSYSDDMAVSTWSPDSLKTLIYARVKFYDENKKRFDRIRNGDELLDELFEKDLDYARKIVENLELVNLRDALYEHLKQPDSDNLPEIRVIRY